MAQTTTVMPTGPIQDAAARPLPKNPSKLEDQAAIAALYVTKYDKPNHSNKSKNGYDILDDDNKLSSAGAAASLKYANPQDLPSYPSTGLKKNDTSAASAAASRGWSNQKTFQHWKPDPSAPAAAAALQAHDYKMPPPWRPEASANGAKAALLAHIDGGKVEIWKPEAKSAWGHSAATQAMASHLQGGLSPQIDYGHTELGRKGSLLAATGAMSSDRKRSKSTPRAVQKPDTYPDESNAASNALRAATSASRASKRSEHSGAGSVPYTTMARDMFTAAPPVQPEVDEKNRADTLRASAIAMAQGMYTYQQKQIEQTKSHAQSGAAAAHGHRRTSSLNSRDEAAPMRFNNLQEAAQRLAQEKLAKFHDEHAQNREYRDYYGSTPPNPSRLSIRGRNRNRASSVGTFESDQEQSNKIRAQMSQFSSNLTQVDAKKRQQDRDNLISAAQRNVTKSMHGMDERVFADTGKIAPSLLNEWEVKAHAAAQANSASRMENHGKVHIGGGKFVDQSEIDAVASRNIQPVLDEINQKAEAERERQAALKLEHETQQRKADEKKAREKEQKETEKKLRQKDKEEKKTDAADEKRATKERRKSVKSGIGIISSFRKKPETETIAGSVAAGETETAVNLPHIEESTIAERRESAAPAPIRTSMEDQASIRMREAAAANGDVIMPKSPSSAGSPKEKNVKNWLKRFSRRMSKGPKSPGMEKEKEPAGGDRKSFIGGVALTGASASNSTASIGANSASVRDVATATPASVSAAAAPASKKTITVDSDVDFESDASIPSHPAHKTTHAPSAQPETAPIPHGDSSRPDTTATTGLSSETERPGTSATVAPAATGLPTSPSSSAPANTETAGYEKRGRRISKNSVVSSMSCEDDDEFQEARDNFDEDLAPPPTFSAKSASPARMAKFHEEI
ncbi:uncharacterized protein L3040_007865 [Drepanopeziza brunnea f. sp. 'multigermtubi']|uniref:uncharacterized protein n=1 Tax=Drepanopeziza brunnea f. sp. 'multigermtubi' TaxID=698441 RepID=UPI0023A08B5E|nr:hypothetical protein L3040_007865 [Drepanopeziza brunnea f. sp. 'multigermtubi']